MKIAIIGGTGQLGMAFTAELSRHGDEPVVAAHGTRPSLDAVIEGAATSFLDQTAPDAVVYLAAITDLERCETEPELAWRLHVRAPAAIARWCAGRSRPLLSVSTDGVFDGRTGGYSELDEVNPLNVYGVTKFLGEREVLAMGGTVIRTNFIGSGSGSLIETLVRRFRAGETVTGFTDAVISPIHVTDLAEVLRRLLHAPVEGLLNVAGQTAVSKEVVARLVCQEVGQGAVVPGILPKRPVLRPRNTSLCSDLAEALVGIVDRGWEAAVRDSVAATRLSIQ